MCCSKHDELVYAVRELTRWGRGLDHALTDTRRELSLAQTELFLTRQELDNARAERDIARAQVTR